MLFCSFVLTPAVMYVLQHAYTDGRLEEPAPVAVIHFHADDGSGEHARNIGLVFSIGLVMQIYNGLLSDRNPGYVPGWHTCSAGYICREDIKPSN
jgi:hypothetical protein